MSKYDSHPLHILNKQRKTKYGSKHKGMYSTWASMIQRCTNPNTNSYKHYGGRGIFVCEPWKAYDTFADWAMLSGYTEGLQIDRIDNDQGYCPENCHFITPAANCAIGKRRLQSNNKTGHRGVSLSKSGNYEVYININKKQKYIGVYKTLEEAVSVRQSLEREVLNEQK